MKFGVGIIGATGFIASAYRREIRACSAEAELVALCARRRDLLDAAARDVRAVVCRWHTPRPLSMPFTWRDDATLSAAGSVADIGSHTYDTLRWLLGVEATRVLAHATVLTPAKPDRGAMNLDEARHWAE